MVKGWRLPARFAVLLCFTCVLVQNAESFTTNTFVVAPKSSVRLYMQQSVVPAESTKNRATASDWHRQRRREMIFKYGGQITPLERDNSQWLGLPLLAVSCVSLWSLAIMSASLPVWAVFLLALFPGSMFSLWQLQLLHDVIHGVMFEKPNPRLQDRVLFWGSMPSVFGYYLYLKAGHLSHHKNMGQHSLAETFESSGKEFEDGDILFVAHRMKVRAQALQ
jgi:fatty acid desaturase